MAWLSDYWLATLGVELGVEPTIRLDLDNEPQPATGGVRQKHLLLCFFQFSSPARASYYLDIEYRQAKPTVTNTT